MGGRASPSPPGGVCRRYRPPLRKEYAHILPHKSGPTHFSLAEVCLEWFTRLLLIGRVHGPAYPDSPRPVGHFGVVTIAPYKSVFSSVRSHWRLWTNSAWQCRRSNNGMNTFVQPSLRAISSANKSASGGLSVIHGRLFRHLLAQVYFAEPTQSETRGAAAYPDPPLSAC